MPIPSEQLANPQHERFAKARAEGIKLVEAHKIAGYAPNPGNAKGLEMRPEVAARIRYLRDLHETELRQERANQYEEMIKSITSSESGIDLSFIQRELLKNLLMARALGKVKEANDAVRLLGDTCGAFEPQGSNNVSSKAAQLDNLAGKGKVSLISTTIDELTDTLGEFDPDPDAHIIPDDDDLGEVIEHLESGRTVQGTPTSTSED